MALFCKENFSKPLFIGIEVLLLHQLVVVR